MSEARDRFVEILKALGFVLAGTLGVVALIAFFQGFRDGYDRSQPTEAQAPAEASVDGDRADDG